MVGHAPLREVVGAYALVAHTGADLALALGRALGHLPRPLRLVEAGGEYLHGSVLVLVLAALVLALDDRARGQVRDADGALGLVHVLAARAGGAEGVYLQIAGVDVYLHVADLGQHGHGDGAGVYPASGLRLRHTLDAVDAALVLEARVGAGAFDHEAYLLYAAQLRLVDVGDGDLPAARLGVHAVHAVKAVREQRALLPADARAYLYDHVALIVRVFGYQQLLYALGERGLASLGVLVLLAGHLAHLRVGEEALGLGHRRLAGEVLPGALGHGRELLLLLRQAGIRLDVGVVLRQVHEPLKLLIPCYYFSELFWHSLLSLSMEYCTTDIFSCKYALAGTKAYPVRLKTKCKELRP